MYRGFRKSRIAMAVIELITLALSAAVWIRNRGRETYIPILASVLLLAIGFMTARIVANIVASTACTDALGLLHMDMKPEEFLKMFSPVVGKLPRESRDRQISRLYLSDGYWAAGKFEDSLSVLKEFPEKWQKDTALAGTRYYNRGRAELAAGDLAAAKTSMKALKECVEKRDNPAKLSATLKDDLGLLNQHLQAVQNGKADIKWLEKQLKQSQYTIRRLEIMQILAMDAMNRGDRSTAKNYLKQMTELSGDTFFHAWAEEKQKDPLLNG